MSIYISKGIKTTKLNLQKVRWNEENYLWNEEQNGGDFINI